ncbi:MAG: GAF domain-containing sensor histidine kinase [Actinobacteria bacterium]|nr:MAG: GAF domain-containing sensor histidine kinase [Actinomycetota bacterium]
MEPVPLGNGELPTLPGADRAFPVRHQGELLGALTVAMPANEPLSPAGEKLIGDLASQAGLVLRNVRLIEELRASRQRLVAAQDEERRRLERNIHDGAQQQLVALGIQLGLAQRLAAKDAPSVAELLAKLQAQSTDALDNLRDLARGIYPPLLADQGLAVALSAQARKAAVPVEVEADGVGRYPQDAEAAVYFCTLEALQNVAKYAAATKVTVRLQPDADGLAFEVTDDGKGFDAEHTPLGSGLQNMADRLAALSGTLEVRSQPWPPEHGRPPGRFERHPRGPFPARARHHSEGATPLESRW